MDHKIVAGPTKDEMPYYLIKLQFYANHVFIIKFCLKDQLGFHWYS